MNDRAGAPHAPQAARVPSPRPARTCPTCGSPDEPCRCDLNDDDFRTVIEMLAEDGPIHGGSWT